MDSIRCLVLIPRGHTMLHLPQSMHPLSIFTASFSLPLCKASITFLKLIPENLPAGHVELHEPQAMHLYTSGSALCSCPNLALSTLSRFMVELGAIPNPKSIIAVLECMNVSLKRQNGPRQGSQGQSWDRCMRLHRTPRPWTML